MLGIKVLTWLKGERVGEDVFGNVYYKMRGSVSPKDRRWVIYKGLPEASKVPAEWHGWLHHMTNDLPSLQDQKTWPWQREHLPNLTGTLLTYRPPGHTLKGGNRDAAVGDYTPWKPE
ncbi:NADH:ubiquinone oxidoreductase subunit [Candidatus Bealeia paramacronuclearis]|uniref:NADH:ubiquinone oxidoreductase subunit n=1 Tax=Candidatus Bealeia paramacronuclearis TaxID=1921001 RepID=A0ABZ2C1U5_9PROT|nr:NADH:ubiquinone oxidoreductase subunit [Candidatus Bealeia paramacronuclearis]